MLLLEEDALPAPDEAVFRERFAMLDELVLRHMEAWDFINLGACLEHKASIRDCVRVRAAGLRSSMWVSRAVHPLCTHAVLLNPIGARKLRYVIAKYLEWYTIRLRQLLRHMSSSSCANVTYVKQVQSVVVVGHDVKIAATTQRQKWLALDVWPHMAAQDDVEWKHILLKSHHGDAPPPACTARKNVPTLNLSLNDYESWRPASLVT